MKMLLATIAGGMVAYGALAQSPRPPAGVTAANQPSIHIAPPLSEEEAKLLGEVRRLVGELGDRSAEEGSEGVKQLRIAVELHFDFLSRHSDERIGEMGRQLARITELAGRRKAARSELVEAEVAKLINDSRLLKFYPDTLSVMKTPGVPRVPPSQGK